jgi:hypothetical protein
MTDDEKKRSGLISSSSGKKDMNRNVSIGTDAIVMVKQKTTTLYFSTRTCRESAGLETLRLIRETRRTFRLL